MPLPELPLDRQYLKVFELLEKIQYVTEFEITAATGVPQEQLEHIITNLETAGIAKRERKEDDFPYTHFVRFDVDKYHAYRRSLADKLLDDYFQSLPETSPIAETQHILS